MKIINVNGTKVYIGEDIFLCEIKKILRCFSDVKICFVADQNVPNIDELIGYIENINNNRNLHFIKISGGEENKNLNSYVGLIDQLIDINFNRRDILISIGGGVVGDLVGFVSATYMRGIKYFQIPTTVISHDSSIGGKTGFNRKGIKNGVGAFYAPFKVIIDVNFYKTLPDREYKHGLAEIIIHSIISNQSNLYEKLKVNDLDKIIDINILAESINIKKSIVEKDYKEDNERKLLNLGHTFGHAIESLTKFSFYRHGEAIAIGLEMAACLSDKLNNTQLYPLIKNLLTKYNLDIPIHESLSAKKILNAMYKDKKVENNRLTLILINDIGSVYIEKELKNDSIVLSAIQSVLESKVI